MGCLLVFDSAFSLEDIRRLGLYQSLKAVDSEKVFAKTLFFNVSSAIRRFSTNDKSVGKMDISFVDASIIVLEPRAGRFKKLLFLKRLNFVLSILGGIFWIFRNRKFWDIQLIRSEDPSLNGLMALVFALLIRKPLIVGIWGNPQRIRSDIQRPLSARFFRYMWIEELVERLVINFAKLILVQNDENARYPRSLGVEPHRILQLPLSLWINDIFKKPKNFYSHVRHNSDDRRFRLFCVTRLESSKRVRDLILLADKLRNRGVNFEISIIGEGALRRNLEKKILDLHLVNHIKLLGEKTQSWQVDNLVKFDLGLAPLLGRSLFEGALLGIPFVGYKVDWHNDLIKDINIDLLVEIGDVEALATSVCLLLFDDDLRNSCASNIRVEALKKLNEKNPLVEFYREFSDH